MEKFNNKLHELPPKINKHVQETYKNKCRVATIFLVFLSLIFFLTMLIGSTNGSVFLSKFTFSQPVSAVLQRNSITFTLLGFCVDDQCTQQVSHDFDKAPTSDEITSGQVQKRDVIGSIGSIGKSTGQTIEQGATGTVNTIGQDASGTVNTIGQGASGTVNTIGQGASGTVNTIGQGASGAVNTIGQDANGAVNTIGQDANKIGQSITQLGQQIVKELLSAFDNFVPKEPTNGKSGWIARPIITASIFNFSALLLLLITNTENRKYCYPSAFILLLISFILNLVSFIITFSLFSLVFDVIGAFPGIGENQTGPAMTLSGFSSLFLLISLSLIIIDGSRRKKVRDSKSVMAMTQMTSND